MMDDNRMATDDAREKQDDERIVRSREHGRQGHMRYSLQAGV